MIVVTVSLFSKKKRRTYTDPYFPDAFNVKNPIQDGGNVFSGSTSQVAVF